MVANQWNTSMSRRGFLGFSAGVAGVVLLGCGGGSSSSGGGGGVFKGQMAVSNYTALPDWSPLIIAEKEGLFSAHDLEIGVLQVNQGPDAVRAAATQTNLGAAATFSGVSAFSAGMKGLRIVGTMITQPSVVFLVRPDSGIEKVTDLKGKKIGVQGETSSATYLGKKMLTSAGMDVSDAEFINVGSVPESQTALANKIVDCAFSVPPLSVTEIESGRAKLLLDGGDIAPDMFQSSLFATEKLLDENEDAVRRFVDAAAEGIRFVKDDVEKAADIWAKETGLEAKTALATLQGEKERLDIKVTKAGIEANLEAAKELGVLKGEVTYEGIVPEGFRAG